MSSRRKKVSDWLVAMWCEHLHSPTPPPPKAVARVPHKAAATACGCCRITSLVRHRARFKALLMIKKMTFQRWLLCLEMTWDATDQHRKAIYSRPGVLS
ncbi:hypothetical protein V5799_003631 [Amblyomma americanum]|uniref:Uncharacterized protein n=1 Tax=Amblyomma americanum TaxID=6943 RepID=A0AAQ4D8E8_AMBAM